MDARAYFNELTPSTREKARAFRPEDRPVMHLPLLDGYREGDPLRASELSWSVQKEETPPDPVRVAEMIFRAMNSDSRPNRSERSLSVGDVVRVGETWLACAPLGFEKIETPKSVETQAPRIVVGA